MAGPGAASSGRLSWPIYGPPGVGVGSGSGQRSCQWSRARPSWRAAALSALIVTGPLGSGGHAAVPCDGVVDDAPGDVAQFGVLALGGTHEQPEGLLFVDAFGADEDA